MVKSALHGGLLPHAYDDFLVALLMKIRVEPILQFLHDIENFPVDSFVDGVIDAAGRCRHLGAHATARRWA